MLIRIYLVALCLVTFFNLLPAQTSTPLSTSQRQQLESLTTRDVPEDAPGVAVGIVQNGQIIFQQCAGFAQLKKKVAIDENVRFNIASNGKQYTALAILQLVEQGKLNLEDDLRKFFPDLYPGISTPIQIQQLLNHSSGIRDVYDLWDLKGLTWWEHPFDNADALQLLGKQEELNFTPGSQYAYSNSNYILLAEVISKVAGSSFTDFTRQLFEQSQMGQTSFIDNYKKIDGVIAKPYFNFDKWTTYDWTWNIHGDGNLFSSLADQLRWEQVIQNAEASSPFSQNTLAKSQKPIATTSIENYGYGLEFGQHRGIPYRFHGGGTGAWKAITLRFPEQNLSIITLTNSGKVDPMGQSLAMADIVLGVNVEEENLVRTPTEAGQSFEIDEIIGAYETPSNYLFRFENRKGELFLLRNGRNDIKLTRSSGQIFHQWNDPTFQLAFQKNEDGQLQVTAYHPSHQPYTLTNIPANWEQFDYKTIVGKFMNSETAVTFQVKHLGGRNYQVKSGKDKTEAVLLSPGELLVYNYRVRFDPNPTGETNELFLNANRIQQVRFNRVP